MHAGLGLDVTQLVRPIVRELQMAQRPTLVRLVETLELALEEIGAFRRDDERWLAGPHSTQFGRGPDDGQPLPARQRMELLEGALGEIIKLARPWIAAWTQAAVGEF